MSDKHYGVKIVQNRINNNEFDISIPQVKLSGNRKKEAAINKIIKDKVRDFIIEELDNEIIMKISVGYRIKLNKKGLLSILFEVCSYFDMKKRIFSAIKSLTLDIKKANIINSSDLFPENSYYEYVINKMITDKIVDGNTPLLQEFSKSNNVNLYYLTEESLVIYIPLYKDTNYAHCYCTPEFVIPLSDIKGLLGPKSPASRLIFKK